MGEIVIGLLAILLVGLFVMGAVLFAIVWAIPMIAAAILSGAMVGRILQRRDPPPGG